MILVTGGAGFIGANLVRALNEAGCEDIVVVDDLSDGTKFRNLADCRIADYFDKDELRAHIESRGTLPFDVRLVYHLGACSTTTQWDGRYMMATNFSYSKLLLDQCLRLGVGFIYASSAAVYGRGGEFTEAPANEAPVNVYGYSKLLFDQYVRRRLRHARSQIVGLRYFNVYGPRESHKGPMASVAFHFNRQLRLEGRMRLFRGSGGYGDGEQRRDFVHVADAVAVTQWFAGAAQVCGIFNVGTGSAQSFNDVARAIIDWHGRGEIEYIPIPAQLEQCYQHYTQADLNALRAAGCTHRFRDVATGVREYLDTLNAD
ncbi:MAG: ADP-glyceromanno-heptose 6-epimerase [Gammaproteobacteria bacterium]|nr:ADP-glyceromanno-heptose 6-epimerase [Gammaproteobacteria bacterium]